jgi:hypothetical protein
MLGRLALLFVFVEALCYIAVGGSERDYAKVLVGDWEGPYVRDHAMHQKVMRFRADGHWGVVLYAGGGEASMGSEWRIEGDKLVLSYVDGRAYIPHTYRIVSLSKANLVLQINGVTEEWERVE